MGLVADFLNRGQWMHTWHLPKNNGMVDWFHPETINKIKDELSVARGEIADLQQQIKDVEIWLKDRGFK